MNSKSDPVIGLVLFGKKIKGGAKPHMENVSGIKKKYSASSAVLDGLQTWSWLCVWRWYVAPVEVRTAGGRQKMGWSMLHCSEWRSTEGRWVECYSEQKKQISQ